MQALHKLELPAVLAYAGAEEYQICVLERGKESDFPALFHGAEVLLLELLNCYQLLVGKCFTLSAI